MKKYLFIIILSGLFFLPKVSFGDTFGNTFIGASPNGDQVDYCEVTSSTLAFDGANVTSITSYVFTGTAENFKAVIYSDVAGQPKSLLATGAATAMPTTAGWVTSTISLSLNAGKYWLGACTQSGTGQVWITDPGSGNNVYWFTAAGSYATPPATWTDYGNNRTRQDSFFATYTTGGAPTLDQESFRFRNDNGDEASATWLTDQDATTTNPLNTNTRVRFIVNASGTIAASQYQLEFKRHASSTYESVATSSATASFGATGADATDGTTALTIPFPAGVQTGDMLVTVVGAKIAGIYPTTPAGWTLPLNSTSTGGRGASGAADRGTSTVTMFLREAQSAESGNLSVTITSGNSAAGTMFVYKKGIGDYWDYAASKGGVNVTSTNIFITGNVDMGVKKDDIVVSAFVPNGDAGDWSNEKITQSGVTYTTNTERVENPSTQGDDLELVVSDHTVTAGVSAGVPTYSASSSAGAANFPAGGAVMMRLRRIPKPILLASSTYINANAASSTTGQLTPPTSKEYIYTGSFGNINTSTTIKSINNQIVGSKFILSEQGIITKIRPYVYDNFGLSSINIKCGIYSSSSILLAESMNLTKSVPVFYGGYVDLLMTTYPVLSADTYILTCGSSQSWNITANTGDINQGVTTTIVYPTFPSSPAFNQNNYSFSIYANYSTSSFTGIFNPGYISDDTNSLPSLSITPNGYTELEWNFIATSTAVDGDVYDFRVTKNGTPLDTYSKSPNLTIGVHSNPPPASNALFINAAKFLINLPGMIINLPNLIIQ